MAAAGPVAEVVVGATEMAATTEFLGLFGLVEVERVAIGDDEATCVFGLSAVVGNGVRLASPAAPGRATVLVVPTAIPGDPTVDWQLGPRALDIYTTDLDRGVAAAGAAGWTASPEAVLAAGPMRMRQQMVTGPDGLAVVLVDSTHRRSSVCDLSDAPLHSEPHSVVWSVADHADELERWVAAGWTAGATINFSEPSVSAELGLPESPTPITMTMLSDPDVAAIRVELMTFDDHVDPDQNAAPLDQLAPVAMTAGLHSLVIDVGSVAEGVAAWGAGATFGEETSDAAGRRVVAGVTRGGVRVLLRGGA